MNYLDDEGPRPEFVAYRAKNSPRDYTDRFILEQFLDKEGRRERRVIDIPEPAYEEGWRELNQLIAAIHESGHRASLSAALASLEVDLDWYDFADELLRTTQDRRNYHRIRRVIETVTTYIANATDATQLSHVHSIEPIRLAVLEVSNELISYLARHPDEMYQLRPRQFEQLIASVLSGFGWAVELTPESQDGGYDILAVSKDVDGSGLRTSYIVECKKYRRDRKVGVGVVRQLLHVKGAVGASNALLVTTSDFTQGVLRYRHDRLDFDAKNFSAVAEWCRLHGRRRDSTR